MAGKVRAGSGPAQELLANAERSGQQEFEPIGMIIRRMIDKSRKAAKEGQKAGQGEEVR
jgi:hypothetical protein